MNAIFQHATMRQEMEQTNYLTDLKLKNLSLRHKLEINRRIRSMKDLHEAVETRVLKRNIALNYLEEIEGAQNAKEGKKKKKDEKQLTA